MDRRSLIWTLSRLLVSVLLLWFVVSRVGFDTLVESVRTLSLVHVLAAVLLSVFNVGLSAWKWQILLRVKGIGASYLGTFEYYYIGQFFNAFLPTAIGGDSVRMYYAYAHLGGEDDAVSSVVVERLTGLVVILALAGFATTFLAGRLPRTVVVAVVGGSVIGLVVLAAFLFTDSLDPLLEPTLFSVNRFGLGERLKRIYRSLTDYRCYPRSLGAAFVISLLFRLVLVLNTYLVSVGLGMDVPFLYFLAIVPLVEVLLFLPVSIQGFGVRETSYLYLFTAVGSSPGHALALGFVMQLVLGVLNNLIGGGVYTINILRR